MAKSLTRILDQIEKLQKEAASIQSTVITRIRREIAQHGLTAEHLFGSVGTPAVGNGRSASPKVAPAKSVSAKPASTAKPVKFADDQGNSWHGMGKRPQWIHELLAAGRSLDDVLVTAKKAAPAARKSSDAAKPAPLKRKTIATKKKVAPSQSTAKSTAKKAKPAAKAPTRKPAKSAPAGKAASKKAIANKPAKATPAAAVEPGQTNA